MSPQPAGKLTAFFSRYRRVVGEGAWAFGGQGAAAVLTLIGTRIVTHYVHPAVFGATSLLLNIGVLAKSVFCAPILAAAIRFYPVALRDGDLPGLRHTVVRSLGLSTAIVAAVLFVAASAWAHWAGISYIVPIALTALFAFDVIRSAEVAFFNGARRQRPAAVAIVAESAMRPLLIVLAVIWFGESLQSIFVAMAATLALMVIGIAATTHREGTGVEKVPGGNRFAGDILRYALPMAPLALLVWISSVSDRYIIQWLSRNAFFVGIYAAAYGLISQPFILTQLVVTTTLRPIYFTAIDRGNHAHARRVMTTWFAVVAGICCGGVLLAFLLRNWLVGTFLAPQYAAAAAVIPWVAFGYLFYDLSQVGEQYILAHKRTELLLISQTTGAIASIIVTIPLVARYGFIGAAYACPCYFFLQGAANLIIIFRISRAPLRNHELSMDTSSQ